MPVKKAQIIGIAEDDVRALGRVLEVVPSGFLPALKRVYATLTDRYYEGDQVQSNVVQIIHALEDVCRKMSRSEGCVAEGHYRAALAALKDAPDID